MEFLLALCGLSVIISTTLAESTSLEQLDEVLLPILTKCEIHVMSHRCVGSDTLYGAFKNNKIDQELEEAALKKFSASGLPYRYTILPCNLNFEEMKEQVQQVGKGRSCQTATWFLKPFREQGRLWIDIRFSFLTHNYYSSGDFVLLVYHEDLQEHQHIAWLDYYPGTQPENLLLVALKPHCRGLGVNNLGVVLRHGNQYGTDFIQWLKKPFLTYSVSETADQNEYFCKFAPRSAYSMCLIRNLNRMPLLMPFRPDYISFKDLLETARSVRLREILVGVKPEFHRHEAGKTLFSLIVRRQPWEYYQFVTAVELYEKLMNLSVQQYRNSELHLSGFPWTAKSRIYHDNTNIQVLYVVRTEPVPIQCVSRLASQIDATSIFNPLDKWTWVCFCFSYLLLGFVLFQHSQSPFFILLAPVFTQDSGLSVRRFSYLVLIWIFTCLLMTYLYSSFIGSFLVAPLPTLYVRDIKELYNTNYKLFLSARPGQNEKEAKNECLSVLTGSANYSSPYTRQRYKYLFKLQENASVLMDANYDDLLTSAVGHGKGCIVTDTPFEIFHYVVMNAYSGHSGVQLKEQLAHLTDSWRLLGSYRSVLGKGLSLFFATGILNVYESGCDLVNLYNKKMLLEFFMRKNNPYYTEGVFYHIGNEESPYLFTLKNEQGRLVFYVWAGLVALTFVPFLVVNRKRIWRVFRRCTKGAKDCLKKQCSYAMTIRIRQTFT